MNKRKVYYFLLGAAGLFFLSTIGVWHNGHFKVSPAYSACIYTPACQCCFGNCGFDCDSAPTDTPTPIPPTLTNTAIPTDTPMATPTLAPTPVLPLPTPNTCGASNQPNPGTSFSLKTPAWLSSALGTIDSDCPFRVDQGLQFTLNGFSYDCCDINNIRTINGITAGSGTFSAFQTLKDIPFPGGGVSDSVGFRFGPDYINGLVSAGVTMDVNASINANIGYEHSLCVFPTSNCFSAMGGGSGECSLKVGGSAHLTCTNSTTHEVTSFDNDLSGIEGTIGDSIGITGDSCTGLIKIAFAAPEAEVVSSLTFHEWSVSYTWAKWEGKSINLCIDQTLNMVNCPQP